MNNTPIIKRKDGNIQVAVFEKQTQDGKTYFSVVLQRSYKKKDSNDYVNETINLFPDDMLKTGQLLEATYSALANYSQQKKSMQVQVQPQPQVVTPTPQATSFVMDSDIPF